MDFSFEYQRRSVCPKRCAVFKAGILKFPEIDKIIRIHILLGRYGSDDIAFFSAFRHADQTNRTAELQSKDVGMTVYDPESAESIHKAERTQSFIARVVHPVSKLQGIPDGKDSFLNFQWDIQAIQGIQVGLYLGNGDPAKRRAEIPKFHAVAECQKEVFYTHTEQKTEPDRFSPALGVFKTDAKRLPANMETPAPAFTVPIAASEDFISIIEGNAVLYGEETMQRIAFFLTEFRFLFSSLLMIDSL